MQTTTEQKMKEINQVMETLARKEEMNQKLSALNTSIKNDLMNYQKKSEFAQYEKQHSSVHEQIQMKFKQLDEEFSKNYFELNIIRDRIDKRAMDQEFKDHVEHSKKFAFN